MHEAIVQHGFLKDDLFQELDATYPEPSLQGFRSTHDMSSRDPDYQELPDCWKKLHDLLHSAEFWNGYISVFPELRRMGYQLTDFKPDEYEGRTGAPKIPQGDVQYARLDIGWGGPGYGVVNGGKGAHIDNWRRVISGLLYFTDQSELKGGEFEFLTPEFKLAQRVPLKQNMAVISVQHNAAWHRVRPLKKVRNKKRWRRAIYFALCDTRDIWDRKASRPH